MKNITDNYESKMKRAEKIAQLMDSHFRVPGTHIRFGLDSIIGLIPGIGDAIAASPTLYYIFLARELKLPKSIMIRMMANLGIDLMVGAIPLIGDLFDVAFKANRKNYHLLHKAISKRKEAR